MSESSDRSDVVRSARDTKAPGSTRKSSDSGVSAPKWVQNKTLVVGVDGTESTTIKSDISLQKIEAATVETDVDYLQPQALMRSESFSEDPFTDPPIGSWEESQSLDDNDDRFRSTSRQLPNDRRKHLDSTTPTLIDEEDDSEMLHQEHTRTNVDKDESSMRRTPGASMYKSSFEISSEEMSSMSTDNIVPEIERTMLPSMHGTSTYAEQDVAHAAMQREPPGLGFGLSLAASKDSHGSSDHRNIAGRQRLRQMVWDSAYRLSSQASSETQHLSSKTAATESSQQIFRETTTSSFTSAPVSNIGSGGMQGPRDSFLFAPWDKSDRDYGSLPFAQVREEGRSSTSGAFSPNILRLTEDIGNLLHEDEDDDFAIAIPGTGQRDHLSNIGSTTEDWTGSYVFDSEAGRNAAKPAVPSRSSINFNNMPQHKDGKPRRKTTGPNIYYQPQHGSFPNAQQPKPRVRSGDEVFEFGKSSIAESNQVLNFGGAFAPPSLLLGNNQNFMHPVPFQPGHPVSDQFGNHVVGGQIQPLVFCQNQEFNSTRGNFQVGISGSNNLLLNSHTFDPYQRCLQTNGAGDFFEPHNVVYSSSSNNPGYRMGTGPIHGIHQSEMQATAREFVPRPSSTIGHFVSQEWPTEGSQWHSPGSPYQALEHSSWHHTVPDSNYSSGYEYRQSPNHGYVDHRSTIGSSAHITPWSQHQKQPQMSLPQQLPTLQMQQVSAVQTEQFSSHTQPFPPTQSKLTPQIVPQLQNVPQPLPDALTSQQEPPLLKEQVVPTPPVAEPCTTCNTSGPTTSSQPNDVVSHQVLPTNRGISSPHLSVADSENSQGTSQLSKKDSKRKQRTKKKPPKADSPAPSKKGPIMSKKKGNKVEPIRSTSTGNDAPEETQGSAIEDPNDAKRSELNESPATRAAFKEFYRAIRNEERSSFTKAEEFAYLSLSSGSLPESVHWRVYLELADLAKRSNRYAEARRLYKMVCQLQPYASQGWLEFSKLEEECGNMNRVMNILHAGLEYCKFSESLLTRAVKHQEKMGNLATARELLARLKHIGIEKVWRTVLEGALLEVRAGNVATARRVLKYLMHHVPWYGPLYLEAYRLEKDQGDPLDALQIVERGLEAIPRYGPLWFGAFRLCEDMDRTKKLYDLPQSMKMIERATASISKELVWKVHLEAAQMLERSAMEVGNVDDPKFENFLVPARRRLAMTVLSCPNNLRWKVWLTAARMELGIGNTEQARALFLRAHEVVPKKGKSSTLLESARLEDFTGNTDVARALLCKGRLIHGHDWKVWFESVLLEIRNKNVARAVEICTNALDIHQGTGRLWATLVQLRQHSGRDSAQQIALRRALNAVPKSGEVWCEGGRIHLNPFSDTFDLVRARRHLFFATRFTPQYGDGFVESIRLELIEQWLSPIAAYIWDNTKHNFHPPRDSGVESSLTKYITDVAIAIAVANLKDADSEMTRNSLPLLLHQNIVSEVRKRLHPEVLGNNIDLSDLRLACVNADPNYGLLWFHCRRRPTDSPRRIIEDAAGFIAAELQKYSHIYLAAIIRRKAVLSTIDFDDKKYNNASVSMDHGALPPIESATDPIVSKRMEEIDKTLQSAPSLEDIFNPIDPTTGLVFLENTVRGALFVTGISDLNRHNPISSFTLADRRRMLFGNDALFP